MNLDLLAIEVRYFAMGVAVGNVCGALVMMVALLWAGRGKR